MKQQPNDPVVEEFEKRVRRVLGSKLVAIYWFGSRARGEDHEESDYDFLVEGAAELSSGDRDLVADISVDMSGRHGVVMDVHYDTWARLHGERRFMTPFRDAVLSEGLAL